MWTHLQVILRNLFDILKIYVKFAILTIVLYLVAEWYILHYGIDLDEAATPPPGPAKVLAGHGSSNSTVYRVYCLVLDFFFR